MSKFVLGFITGLLFGARLAPAAVQLDYRPVDVRSLHDKISVRMHQAKRFTFDQRGDRFLNPRPVRGARKEPAVMVQLTNEIGGGVSGVNFLILSSTYPHTLRCRGAARFRGKAPFFVTGVYTIQRKDPTAASFHDPIQEFIIWDIRLGNERK